jgi:hypothetical protein
MEMRNNADRLDAMAHVLNRVEKALAELEGAKAAFEELVGYGAPFAPDKYKLERICGLREETR